MRRGGSRPWIEEWICTLLAPYGELYYILWYSTELTHWACSVFAPPTLQLSRFAFLQCWLCLLFCEGSMIDGLGRICRHTAPFSGAGAGDVHGRRQPKRGWLAAQLVYAKYPPAMYLGTYIPAARFFIWQLVCAQGRDRAPKSIIPRCCHAATVVHHTDKETLLGWF
jgi:hypothetical protein